MALGGLGLRLPDLADALRRPRPRRRAVPLDTPARDVRAAKAAPRAAVAPAAAVAGRGLVRRRHPARRAAAGQRQGRPLAYKTGTSYGFRDAWAVGYDGRYTIAVWVGRPDGAATPGLAGRTAAAPLLFDAFARLGAGARRCAGRRPARCASPAPTCRRRSSASARAAPRRAPAPYLEPRVQIAFPPDRSEIEVEDDGAGWWSRPRAARCR